MTKEEARVEMQKCNGEIMKMLNEIGNGGDVEEIAVKSAAMRIRLNECFAVLCTKEI